MDYLDLTGICDAILTDLNGKQNTMHTYLYTEFFRRQYQIGPSTVAISRLLKDGFIFQGKDANKDPEKQPNYPYLITPEGQTFIEAGGYTKELSKKEELINLSMQKMQGELEKLTNELGDYQTTKSRTKNSFTISILALGLSALTLMRLLTCNTPH